MRATERPTPRIDFLQVGWLLLFVSLLGAWVALISLPGWKAEVVRTPARLAGYVGFLAMLIPYLHILRRTYRGVRGTAMTTWMRWHIGAAYLAFAMVLLHSGGRATTPLTALLLGLTVLVMVSGIIGFYGQKLVYALMTRMVPREYGLERLDAQREEALEAATSLLAKKEMKTLDGAAKQFCQAVVDHCLTPPLRFRLHYLWNRSEPASGLLSENSFDRAKLLAEPAQQPILDDLWKIAAARRDWDLEYTLHQIGRLWLYVHGPASWALLVVMIEHVLLSWWYGGF